MLTNCKSVRGLCHPSNGPRAPVGCCGTSGFTPVLLPCLRNIQCLSITQLPALLPPSQPHFSLGPAFRPPGQAPASNRTRNLLCLLQLLARLSAFLSMSAAGIMDSRTPGYLTSWRLYTVIACLCFSQLLIALDTNIIVVPLPRIASEFKDLEAVAWYSTAYILTITVFQPLFGAIYKQWSPAVVYELTIIVFEGEWSSLCHTTSAPPEC